MNFLSLFAGIGGLDLGMERAGWTCVGQVECDPFCQAVLAKHWPAVERWAWMQHLLKELRNGRRIAVDAVVGGFPCQDISVAGKGRGLAGRRSRFWFAMLETVRHLRPAWVVVENVPALRSRGADTVLAGLESAGYACRPVVVGAWAAGAPHQRDRIWIVADRPGVGRERREGDAQGMLGDGPDAGRQQGHGQPAGAGADGVADSGGAGLARRRPLSGGSEPQDARPAGGGDAPAMADPAGDRLQRRSVPVLERGSHQADADAAGPGDGAPVLWPSRPGEPQHGWEPQRLVELPLGGDVDGVPAGLVRFANRNALRAYGNAVVPAVPQMIAEWINLREGGAA